MSGKWKGALKAQGAAVIVAPMLVMAAHAAEPVLAKGRTKAGDEVQIHSVDVASDLQRIPPEVRPQVLQESQTMNKLVSNLYMRRALAQIAQAQGLGQAPETVAALALSRDKVLSDALLAHIDKKSTPSDAQALEMARTMYHAESGSYVVPEQVQIRHILVAPKDTKDSGADAEAKTRAQELLTKLRSGGDFAALAREHSADPGSSAKGGDLGFFERGRMVPAFDTAAFALEKPGDLSELVKTPFGYHILQLQARKPAGRQSFEDVKEGLLEKVRTAQRQKARAAILEELQSGVVLDEPAIRAAFEKLVPPAPK